MYCTHPWARRIAYQENQRVMGFLKGLVKTCKQLSCSIEGTVFGILPKGYRDNPWVYTQCTPSSNDDMLLRNLLQKGKSTPSSNNKNYHGNECSIINNLAKHFLIIRNFIFTLNLLSRQTSEADRSEDVPILFMHWAPTMCQATKNRTEMLPPKWSQQCCGKAGIK